MGERASRIHLCEGHFECKQCRHKVPAVPWMYSRFTIPSTKSRPGPSIPSTTWNGAYDPLSRHRLHELRNLYERKSQVRKERFTILLCRCRHGSILLRCLFEQRRRRNLPLKLEKIWMLYGAYFVVLFDFLSL